MLLNKSKLKTLKHLSQEQVSKLKVLTFSLRVVQKNADEVRKIVKNLFCNRKGAITISTRKLNEFS